MKEWDASPFIKFMGVKVITRGPDRSEAELVNRDELCNRRDVMHGGAIMALADIMGGMTASASLSPDPGHGDDREQDQFLRADPAGRQGARGLHAAAFRPHHHRAANQHHPRRRAARRDG